MNRSKFLHDPGVKGRPYLDEADIGSGEKTPAELETEDMIREIPPLPPSSPPSQASDATRRPDEPPTR